MPFWPSVTTLHLIIGGVVLLIALGFALTCAVGIMRGMLWCLSATSRLMSWLWRWFTGKAPTSHGSSHWADESEIAAKGLFNPGSIPLGTWHGKPLYEASGGHVALIGPPRSRKSWGLLMPAIAGFDGSIVVNDPRAELWQHTHTAREAKGPTYRFNPTGKASCALNVVDAIRWGEDEAYGDVQRLAHGLLSPDVGQPWDDFRLQAAALFSPILMHCHSLGQGSLPGVLRWLTDPAMTMKDQAAELSGSANPIVQAGGRRLKDLLTSERTASIVWNHLISALDIYADPIVAATCDHSDVDLRTLQHGARPASLFLTPPFSDVARLRPLLGTLTEMVTALFSAQQEAPRQKVALFLDEIGNLGALRELERGQSFLQGCGVQIIQVWQNVLQLRQVYGPDSPILASVATKVFYTPADQETTEVLSDELGVTTEQLHPETQHRSFWGLLTSTSLGTSEHERPLLTADECRRLDDAKAIILVKGTAPILGTKLGSPEPEVIDLARPILRRVAAGAAGLAAVCALTGWTIGQMRGASPSAPPQARLSAPGTITPVPIPWSPQPAPDRDEDPWTMALRDSPREQAQAILEAQAKAAQEPKPWRLVSYINGTAQGFGRYPTGHFKTAAECQEALTRESARYIRIIRASATPMMPAKIVEREHYISFGYGHKSSPKMVSERTEIMCLVQQSPPT